jgi:hypothetical protein
MTSFDTIAAVTPKWLGLLAEAVSENPEAKSMLLASEGSSCGCDER